MANRKMRIAAQLSGKTRALLLRMVQPLLPNVYCEQVTYAYGVDPGSQVPHGPLKVVIWGVHRTPAHEALVCTVNGETTRQDGKPFHITLSTAQGVPPAHAGDILLGNVTHIKPITLELEFVMGHARVSRPQQLERLAA